VSSPVGAAAPTTGPDPDVIAAAVLACPQVVRLSGGVAGEVATYLPGRRVAGVRITPSSVEVSVVAPYGPTAADIAAGVRAAVRAVAGPGPVHVMIADLELPAADIGASALSPV